MVSSWSTFSRFVLAATLATAPLAHAAPSQIAARQAITTLTQAQINTFTPYAFFASAGYCQPANTLAWNCGANCNGVPDFKPVASGGDGDSTQFCEFAFPAH